MFLKGDAEHWLQEAPCIENMCSITPETPKATSFPKLSRWTAWPRGLGCSSRPSHSCITQTPKTAAGRDPIASLLLWPGQCWDAYHSSCMHWGCELFIPIITWLKNVVPERLKSAFANYDLLTESYRFTSCSAFHLIREISGIPLAACK